MLDGLTLTDGEFTDCDTPEDVLLLKLLSPPYEAVRVRLPVLENVIEQLPVCVEELRVAVQDSLVLAETVTEPVGPEPGPAAVTLIVTACCGDDGLGVLDVMLTVLLALVAFVFCVALAVRYFESAAQVAVKVQVPLLLTMVTSALALAGVPVTEPTVQTVLPVICGIVLALVAAVTVKVP